MNKKISILCIIILLMVSSNFSLAQSDSLRKIGSDSLNAKIIPETATKSPSGAILRSLALPGWGQYYVESYWKAPMFVAGWGTLIFFIYDNNSKFQDAKIEYANYSGTDPNEKNFLYRKREYFRDYRDLNVFFLAGVYIISSIDAYVGAHLFDFNVNDNLTLDYRLNKFGNPEVGLIIKF